MKTLYIDCTNGISGDMLLKALEDLADEAEVSGEHHDHGHDGQDDHDHHGRAYSEVKKIINTANEIALKIYEVIAKAEATVHGHGGETAHAHCHALDTLHFHEVGRNQAIMNAMGIGMALARIGPDQVIASQINDGKGFVDCAHGRIPVPVPAVRAMMDECEGAAVMCLDAADECEHAADKCDMKYPNFVFSTCEDVKTEMVTPSGLASLIGIGAQQADGMMLPEGTIIASVEVKGTRDTGRPGLRAYLIEK